MTAALPNSLPARKPPQSERRKSSRTKAPKTVAELYALHESLGEQAKALYDQKDEVLKKLVRAWKKNREEIVLTEKHKTTGTVTKYMLDVEDQFRGEIKCFAPAFAHRYKLKLRSIGAA
jgi:hypothetical protein